MNKTAIEWTDFSWNPIIGCSAISDGCSRCYAASMSKRFRLPWGEPVFKPERLGQPAKVKKPSRVFVCSMSDIGHPDVDPQWRHEIYQVMQATRHHTYIILTKRPGEWLRTVPEQVWVGVTIENENHLDRWDVLLAMAAHNAVRFVSVEPMLAPITFCRKVKEAQPKWVIAGPETGPKARECRDEWIEDLARESPVFFDKRKEGWLRREFPK